MGWRFWTSYLTTQCLLETQWEWRPSVHNKKIVCPAGTQCVTVILFGPYTKRGFSSSSVNGQDA